MRERIHLIHHQRRLVFRILFIDSTLCFCHIGLVSHSNNATASEKCQQEKRKTVNGEDILFAMTSLGFENYAEALKIYLTKYREVSTVAVWQPVYCHDAS